MAGEPIHSSLLSLMAISNALRQLGITNIGIILFHEEVMVVKQLNMELHEGAITALLSQLQSPGTDSCDAAALHVACTMLGVGTPSQGKTVFMISDGYGANRYELISEIHRAGDMNIEVVALSIGGNRPGVQNSYPSFIICPTIWKLPRALSQFYAQSITESLKDDTETKIALWKEIVEKNSKNVNQKLIKAELDKRVLDNLSKTLATERSIMVDLNSSGLMVDIVFIVDTTASMTPWVHSVARFITGLTSSVKARVESLHGSDCTLRWGCVSYKDMWDPHPWITHRDFSLDPVDISTFLKNCPIEGGGDDAEDLSGALDYAYSTLSWKSRCRVVVVVTDAPAHGSEMHDAKVSDFAQLTQLCSRPPEKKSSRGRKATDLFTQYAGKNFIKDAKTDQYGNASGFQFDLGKDGAFTGLKIVVVDLYRIDFSQPAAALKTKGFSHVLLTGTITVQQLDKELSDANQFWLISTSSQVLTDQHFQIIEKHWREGLNLYILGDNQPFYVDANCLLKRLVNLEMSGNTMADRVVEQGQSPGNPGFVPNHLLTTSITKLYAGVTVAYFDPVKVKQAGFEEILREHENHLVVIAKPGKDGCGSIIADGAFTKFFYKWDFTGSDRFVRNCACWLSATNTTSLSTNEKPEVIVDNQNGRRDPREIIKQFKQDNVAVLFTKITNRTDIMIKEFRRVYDNPNEQKSIVEIDLQKYTNNGQEKDLSAEEKDSLDKIFGGAVSQSIAIQLASFL